MNIRMMKQIFDQTISNRCIILFVVAASFAHFEVSGAAAQGAPSLNGTWYFRGIASQRCEISQSGTKLQATSEKGVRGNGSVVNSTTIKIDFPFDHNLTGTITENGNRIAWSNGEFWSRTTVSSGPPPVTSNLNGTWYFRGLRNQECKITQNGDKVQAISEKGVRGNGAFVDSTTFVVDFPFDHNLRGTITENGNRIAWSNGEFWTRTPTSGSPVLAWEQVGTGDCQAHDVGSTQGFTPDNTKAATARLAVCWNGTNFNNTNNPGKAWCTYKDVAPAQCTGGPNRGVMYQPVSK
jgi:hypothetical protein